MITSMENMITLVVLLTFVCGIPQLVLYLKYRAAINESGAYIERMRIHSEMFKVRMKYEELKKTGGFSNAPKIDDILNRGTELILSLGSSGLNEIKLKTKKLPNAEYRATSDSERQLWKEYMGLMVRLCKINQPLLHFWLTVKKIPIALMLLVIIGIIIILFKTIGTSQKLTSIVVGVFEKLGMIEGGGEKGIEKDWEKLRHGETPQKDGILLSI